MRLELGEFVSCGFYISTVIACIVFLIYRYVKRYRLTKEHMVMTFLLWNLLLTGIIESTKIILAYYNATNLITWQRVGSFLYFIIHTTLSPAFTIYVLLINGAAKNKPKRFYWILFSVLLIPEVFVLITPFTGCVFYYTIVDGYITYNRGWAMVILYIVAVMYLGFAIVLLLRSWNVVKNKHLEGYKFFLVIIVLGILIQLLSPILFHQTYEVEAFFEVVAIIGLLLTVDCNDALIDGETKLKNGSSYKINITLYRYYNYRYSVLNLRFTNLSYYQSIISKNAQIELLNYISNSFVSICPQGEHYRYDNDTFIVIVPRSVLPEKSLNQIREYYDRELSFDGFELYLEAVASIARVPHDIETLDEHLRILDAKPLMDKQLTIIMNDDLTYLKRHSMVDKAINKAIKEKSFLVYYQPIYDNEEKRIVSCEALCRLIDDELGFISPSEFIPIAEENGGILALGNIVIEKVCKDIDELHFRDLGIEWVELNLSLYQLKNKELVNFINENLKLYNIPTSMLNLEVTETRKLEESVNFEAFMTSLVEQGFSFSLDDYGTAYSNITNVISVHYKNIKIDSSILWKAMDDEKTKKMLDLTIKTFKDLGNNVIQEGVETKEQLDFVTNAGANLIQGYYFSKPIPRLDFIEFIKNFNK